MIVTKKRGEIFEKHSFFVRFENIWVKNYFLSKMLDKGERFKYNMSVFRCRKHMLM